MTDERYSDEQQQLARARAERDRLELVQDVLWDMYFAASDSQARKGFAGPASFEDERHAHWRAANNSLRDELDAAKDREHELLFGSEFVERSRRLRAERRQARRIERSR